MQLSRNAIPVGFLPYRRGRIYTNNEVFKCVDTSASDGSLLLASLDHMFTEHLKVPDSPISQYMQGKHYMLDNHTCYIVSTAAGQLLGFWNHDGRILIGTVTTWVPNPEADAPNAPRTLEKIWSPDIPLSSVVGY